MKVAHGDLIQLALAGKFDVIVHGCNCFCTMAAGIAKSIKQHFSMAYKIDLATIKGDPSKLGTCTWVVCKNRMGLPLTVVNAYTQYKYWGQGVKANYNAIRSCFKVIHDAFMNERIGMPLIGCGLAKGNPVTVKTILEEELKDRDVTLVVLDSKFY